MSLHVFTCFYMYLQVFTCIYMMYLLLTLAIKNICPKSLKWCWMQYKGVFLCGKFLYCKKKQCKKMPPNVLQIFSLKSLKSMVFFSCVPHGGRPAQVLSAPDTRLQRVRHFGARCSGAGDSCEDDAQKRPAGGGTMGYLSARAGRA